MPNAAPTSSRCCALAGDVRERGGSQAAPGPFAGCRCLFLSTRPPPSDFADVREDVSSCTAATNKIEEFTYKIKATMPEDSPYRPRTGIDVRSDVRARSAATTGGRPAVSQRRLYR